MFDAGNRMLPQSLILGTSSSQSFASIVGLVSSLSHRACVSSGMWTSISHPHPGSCTPCSPTLVNSRHEPRSARLAQRGFGDNLLYGGLSSASDWTVSIAYLHYRLSTTDTLPRLHFATTAKSNHTYTDARPPPEQSEAICDLESIPRLSDKMVVGSRTVLVTG